MEEHGHLSLKELIDDPETNEAGLKLHVLIDHPVLSAIQDHAYTDSTNEIIGHLGGIYCAEQHMVHILHSTASARDVNSLRPDSVEESDTGQHIANVRFQELGLQYVGWYHSHPRIKPLPSTKDLRTQSELQAQLSYAIGLICAPYMQVSSQGRKRTPATACYISAFRTLSTHDVRSIFDLDLVGIKVSWAIRELSFPPPSFLAETQKTLQVTLDEAKAWFEQAMLQHDAHPHRASTHRLKYIQFLNSFLTNSVASNSMLLQQQLRSLAHVHTREYRRFLQLASQLKPADAQSMLSVLGSNPNTAAKPHVGHNADYVLGFDSALEVELAPVCTTRSEDYVRMCNGTAHVTSSGHVAVEIEWQDKPKKAKAF